MPSAVCSITQMELHVKDSGWFCRQSAVSALTHSPQGKGVSHPLLLQELFLSHLTL